MSNTHLVTARRRIHPALENTATYMWSSTNTLIAKAFAGVELLRTFLMRGWWESSLERATVLERDWDLLAERRWGVRSSWQQPRCDA